MIAACFGSYRGPLLAEFGESLTPQHIGQIDLFHVREDGALNTAPTTDDRRQPIKPALQLSGGTHRLDERRHLSYE